MIVDIYICFFFVWQCILCHKQRTYTSMAGKMEKLRWQYQVRVRCCIASPLRNKNLSEIFVFSHEFGMKGFLYCSEEKFRLNSSCFISTMTNTTDYVKVAQYNNALNK